MDRYNAAVDPHSTAWCPYRSTGLRVPATYRHQDGACLKAEMPYTTVNNGRATAQTTVNACGGISRLVVVAYQNLVGPEGFEPSTNGLRVKNQRLRWTDDDS